MEQQDKTFFGRLQKLFSTGTIVRRSDDGLKVADINKVQANPNLATNRVIDRFNRLYQSSQNTGYNQQANFHTMRIQLYTDYEIMDEDSIISAALDIYADESTLKNEMGDVLKINSDNEEIEKVLNNLFYDILNIEFNAWPWVRNMCKYGDFYLKLDITEKVGITNVTPMSSYEMFREDGVDPNNPELVQFIHDESMGGVGGTKAASELSNYEVAHFRLLNDMNFLPYGKSMVEPARKTWKQLTLMEDAMMIHRIMRAPEKRIYKIDIGNIPPNEVDAYMQRVMQSMKKTPYIDSKTGNYNLKFNMQNMMEDVYLPVRGGQSGTEIESLSGMDFGGIDDIEYLKNRMFAALKIPKAFMGYEEDLNAKSTLAAQDIRFARTIERIQRIFVSELTKIAMVHLYSQGFEDQDMLDFELELAPASTIAEQEKMELWSTKVDLASSMKDLGMMSQDWIYENLFDLNDEDVLKIKDQVIGDKKQDFRKTSIESEGVDPQAESNTTPTQEGVGKLGSKKNTNLSKNERREIFKSLFPNRKSSNSNLLSENNILDEDI
tara:strand:- start:817 stop:2466 length:1650 start_codon:yes stop_codon:yes gene_type:complete